MDTPTLITTLKGSKDNADGTYTVKLRLTSAIRYGVLCYLGPSSA